MDQQKGCSVENSKLVAPGGRLSTWRPNARARSGHGYVSDVPVYYPGTKRKPVSHESLAEDAYVQRQMLDILKTLISDSSSQLVVQTEYKFYTGENIPSDWLGLYTPHHHAHGVEVPP